MSDKSANDHQLTRREFTLESALALLAGVTITVTDCGGDTRTPTSPTPTTSTAVDVNGSVSGNHGHTAIITGAQITAAREVTLDIRGDATHPHTVSLTADEVRRIGARTQVTKNTTTDNGHSHTVTFN